jgi:hypothetical protein
MEIDIKALSAQELHTLEMEILFEKEDRETVRCQRLNMDVTRGEFEDLKALIDKFANQVMNTPHGPGLDRNAGK